MTTIDLTPTNPAQAPVETVTGVIDGVTVTVPKGTLIIRAAEQLGIAIPRFCDHPLLDPVAACRQCLIEIEGMPKPQPSCAIPLGDGMVVRTQLTSEVSKEAQRGVMEFLLINHPLDCPICDKGGECPLQNQAMTDGQGESRFTGPKRTWPKPINVSAQILLDRERCISCARCTRFASEIAGDAFIDLFDRGWQQRVGAADDKPFDSYFSGNTVQICPVGALTSARYRFRARPFDLVSHPTVCEHCSAGCGLRTDVRRQVVQRRQSGDVPEVNEEWNCDKGRFAFSYLNRNRLERPMVREDGELRVASWPEALSKAADGLRVHAPKVGVLTGGRLPVEDAYGYAKFARLTLGTDNIDFRNRARSQEEDIFLRALAGRRMGVTYADLEQASQVITVAFEPEEEAPIVFLRLRKAMRKHGLRVRAVSPFASYGLGKLKGELLMAAPGEEAGVLATLAAEEDFASLDKPTIVMVGERAAAIPGLLTAVTQFATSTGARVAWVPRRAGDRAALEGGALAGVLPGGYQLADPSERSQAEQVWQVSQQALEAVAPGRTATEILTHAAAGSDDVKALLIAGVDPTDDPDPFTFRAALERAEFVVALSTHNTEVTAAADVVLPVAAVTEKAGRFVDWEGRDRAFAQVFADSLKLSDARVLALIADEIEVDGQTLAPYGSGERDQLQAELAAFGQRVAEPADAAVNIAEETSKLLAQAPSIPARALQGNEAVLSTWRYLLDDGVMQADEPYLAATARPAVVRVSEETAARLGLVSGGKATLSGARGSVTFPVTIAHMPPDIVWAPLNTAGSSLHERLGTEALPGSIVQVAPATGEEV